MESANELGLNNINLSDALFKEADPPHFDNNFLILPVRLGNLIKDFIVARLLKITLNLFYR